MELQFKLQQYQTDAVESIIQVFEGQEYNDTSSHRHDFGKGTIISLNNFNDIDNDVSVDYDNGSIQLSDEQILKNINTIQRKANIPISKKLNTDLGRCSLDIEMETGTGKTYVYTKSMYELNKRYGWKKFIIVVPSVAIREGVKKSLETTQKHFKELYGKKIMFSIYNSSNLQNIDEFSQCSDIYALIINSQAFAKSLKEGSKNKASRIIYSVRDEFGSRRPIDVIAANNPILILDEPQKLDGKVTQSALKKYFNALFTLNFSATHKTEHNKIYILDALDAYNKKLVKKIEVKGIELNGIGGIEKYLYLQDIIIDPIKSPEALIEIEHKLDSGTIKRKTYKFSKNDDLYQQSGLETYRNMTITEIDAIQGIVKFTNGIELHKGEVIGDISEQNLRRIQIREAIHSHFEKEQQLFPQNIKCLTLFFIDKVAKYRNSNEDDNLGEYGHIFEEEYNKYIMEHIFTDEKYNKYVRSIKTSETHKGYFSIDKTTKHFTDSEEKKGMGSDDVDAYDLIMRQKERLLSFEEPTRFIFSHSALREGWDNPNIFQICVLKNSSEKDYRRQEVGRGLRLCVDKDGNRLDYENCGKNIHDINTLTVIAGEGYDTFVRGLQEETKSCIAERPSKIDADFFKGRSITTESGTTIIDKNTADLIQYYLIQNSFIDHKGQITDKCKNLVVSEELMLTSLPDELKDISEGLTEIIRAAAENRDVSKMFENGRRPKIKNNNLNDNFLKKEFQELWNRINRKYVYRADFNSEELIYKAVASINLNLYVTAASYNIRTGKQNETISVNDLDCKSGFTEEIKHHDVLKNIGSQVPHDLIGEISAGCKLTRRTIVSILKQISEKKFDLYRSNPEEFISNTIRLINEQKATMVVNGIHYDQLADKYESTIFTMSKTETDFEKALLAKKHIQDYVFTDGFADKSIERKFAEELEKSDEVEVYAKLPRSLQIPTPVGNYSPDWAIAFKENSVKHIYFVAETKGSMESLQLRPIEQAKIECATKLFEQMSSLGVKYHAITNYSDLLKIVKED